MSLSVTFTAVTTQLMQAIQQVQQAIQGMGQNTQASTTSMSASMQALTVSIQALTQHVQQAQQALIVLSRINAVPASLGQTNALLQQLIAQAQQTRSAINALGNSSGVAGLASQIGNAVAQLQAMQQLIQQMRNASVQMGTALQNAVRVQTQTLDNSLQQISGHLQQIRSQAQTMGTALQSALTANTAATVAGLQAIVTQLQHMRQESATASASLQQALQQAQQNAGAAGAAAGAAAGGVRGLAAELKNLAGAYLGVQAIQQALGAIVRTTVEFDGVRQKLKYVTGDMDSAKAKFDEISKSAQSMGLSAVDSAASFASLAAATKGTRLEGEQTTVIFNGMMKAAASMHLSNEEVKASFMALAQIASKGVVSMEELRQQLGERLPPVMQLSAKAMGMSTAELNKLIATGTLASSEFLPIFGKAMNEAFTGAASNAQTLGGQITNLKNELTILLDKIGSGGLGVGLKMIMNDAKNGINEFSDALNDLDPAMVEAVKAAFSAFYETLKTVAVTLAEAFVSVNQGINDLFSGISVLTGSVDQSSERVSFLTRTLQGLSIVIGIIDDGVKGIGIAFQFTIASMELTLADYHTLMSKITFGEMSENHKKSSEEMLARHQETMSKVEDAANRFQSSSVAALDRASKSTREIQSETVKSALDGYEAMKIKAGATAEDLKHAFQEYADATIKANGGVISSELEKKAAAEGYFYVESEGKKRILKSNEELQQSQTKTTQVIKTSLGEIQVAATKAGTDTEEAFRKLAKESGVTIPLLTKNTSDMAKILAEASVQSKELASSITDKLGESMKKMDAAQAIKFSKEFSDALKTAGADAEYFAKVNLAMAGNIAKAIGVDIRGSLNGLSQDYKDSKAAIEELSSKFTELGQSGVNAGHLIADSMNEALKKASNPAEVEDLIKQWEKLGRQGKVTGQDMADGLQAAKDKLDALRPGINSVEEAFKKLGLTSRSVAQQQASEYEEAYRTLRNSGQATTEQLQEAFRKWAGTGVGAFNDVKKATLENEAAMLGLSYKVSETGKTTVDSMASAKQSVGQVGAAANDAAGRIQGMGGASRSAADATELSVERQLEAYGRLGVKIDEILSKQRGAQVNSANNLSGVSVGAYSKEDIARKLEEMGKSASDARALAADIFQGFVDQQKTLPSWQASLSNYGYVNDYLSRIKPSASIGEPTKKFQLDLNVNGKMVQTTVDQSQEASLVSALQQARQVS